jgi:hypothetical protein
VIKRGNAPPRRSRCQAAGAAVLLFALTALACAAGSRAPEAARLPEQRGTIVRVGDFGYGIVPKSDPGTRYAPESLPEEFRADGLKVLFAGVLPTPPPGARLWGTPLRLTSIRRAP